MVEERGLRRIFLILNTIAAIAMSVLFYFVVHQQHQISNQNKTIQDERAQAIFSSCQDQNSRHDTTITDLRKIYTPILRTASPVRRRQLQLSLRNTVLLIDALAPKQNCHVIANQAVTPPSNTSAVSTQP